MNEKTQTIVWDYDGVINLSTINGRIVWQESFERDIGHDTKQFEDVIFGPGFSQILLGQEDLIHRINKWRDLVSCKKSSGEILQYWYKNDTKLDEGLLSLIRYLKSRGLSQIIATNTDCYRATYIQAQLMENGIDIPLVASGFIGELKPSDKFLRTVEAIAGSASTYLLIDDSPKNTAAAIAFGWRAIEYNPNLTLNCLLKEIAMVSDTIKAKI